MYLLVIVSFLLNAQALTKCTNNFCLMLRIVCYHYVIMFINNSLGSGGPRYNRSMEMHMESILGSQSEDDERMNDVSISSRNENHHPPQYLT